ncbi:MAG: DoxX family protein [Planctomycetes bacterium]|nr:DoxX family protein [Planctomycetota bacterium]
MSKPARTVSWIAQLVSAVILGQTLFFKFSGAEESVALFETLGAEPWGRYGTGAAEAVAVVLLLLPRTAALGALLGVGLMVGAIGSHLTKLGIEWHGDGGLLFGLAVTTLVASLVVLWLRRGQLPLIGARLARA